MQTSLTNHMNEQRNNMLPVLYAVLHHKVQGLRTACNVRKLKGIPFSNVFIIVTAPDFVVSTVGLGCGTQRTPDTTYYVTLQYLFFVTQGNLACCLYGTSFRPQTVIPGILWLTLLIKATLMIPSFS